MEIIVGGIKKNIDEENRFVVENPSNKNLFVIFSAVLGNRKLRTIFARQGVHNTNHVT